MKKIGEVIIDDFNYKLWGKVWKYKDKKYASIFFNIPENLYKNIEDTIIEISLLNELNFKIKYNHNPYTRHIDYVKIYIVNLLENINTIIQKLKNLEYGNIKFNISKDFDVVISHEIIKNI